MDTASASFGSEWMLSSDAHVVEPPDLFTSRFPQDLRPFAPQTVTVDGKEWWLVQDQLGIPIINAARAGDRYDPVEDRRQRLTFSEDVPAYGYEPDKWLKAQEADGVWGGVVQCSAGLLFYGLIQRPDVMTAICRIYNDFAYDFTSYNPERMKFCAMLNIDDIDDAISEAERAASRRAVALMLPVDTASGYEGTHYDRLWEALSDIGLPLHFHIATARYPCVWRPHVLKRSGMVNWADLQIRITLTDLILSGVFDRFPSLQFVSVENEGGWAPHWLARMDWHYQNNFRWVGLNRLAEGRVPSDYFRSNIRISFTEDASFVRNREDVGISRMMWGSDFPHAEGTYPRSHSNLSDQFAHVPPTEVRALVRTNTQHLYGFNPPSVKTATDLVHGGASLR
jgi:predicted TIM-barrel fold metal-dependent hydrolase